MQIRCKKKLNFFSINLQQIIYKPFIENSKRTPNHPLQKLAMGFFEYQKHKKYRINSLEINCDLKRFRALLAKH